ncbi:hypothetical protein ACIBKX_03045 [Streptomyces sp. NPDC050658]|uniref:hypothetical protein n=1 Tax=unclassified Streptomyces TaxID=2593676 RepID=UPI00342A7481
MRSEDAEARLLESSEWGEYRLADLPGVDTATYGIVEPGPYSRGGFPLLQAQGIADGALQPDSELLISARVHEMHRRTWLTPGDVALVVVGRFGAAAVVDDEHSGWNAARSVGVIKINSVGRFHRMGHWIRHWLRSSRAREWCEGRTTQFARTTLSVGALRQLPVPLPPRAVREHTLDQLDLIDRKTAVNSRIAARSVDLADAYFEEWRGQEGHPHMRLCGEVAQVRGGVSEGAVDPVADSLRTVAHVAPQEILQSPTPYLGSPAQQITVSAADVTDGSGLLVATKPGELKVLWAAAPVVPKRGAVAVRPETEEDGLWLLHELRMAGPQLMARERRRHTRELSRRAFSQFQVQWPSTDVRARFSRIAAPLHHRAQTAIQENRMLADLAGEVVNEMAAEVMWSS